MSCTPHPASRHPVSPQSRHLRLAQRMLAAAMLLSTAACGTLEGLSFHTPFHVPFTKPKQPDLTPARASADNLIRLDAAIRSGCDQVDNIERPAPGSAEAGSATTPQRWIARTCTGDISYDVVTVQGDDGPTVKVTPVPGPTNRPMNSHFIPAMPDTPPPIEGK